MNQYSVQIVEGGVTAAAGYLAAGVAAGIKYIGKKDVALIFSQQPATAAGMYTTNRVQAAPLRLTRRHIAAGHPVQAIVVNSGNANACTGPQGESDALAMAGRVAEKLGLNPENVLVASTGVIGQPMPMGKVLAGIEAAAAALSREGGTDAAEAIMTTDTELKQHALAVSTSAGRFVIGGMAKGSGMIHPNMATMLCFLTTDAAVPAEFLQQCLRQAVEATFNQISVDGDTSTNDMVVLLANGAAGVRIEPGSPQAAAFQDALEQICTVLAKKIARDGEGATHLIQARVQGAATLQDARRAARAIVSSSLFKAAVFGRDANWGRIICALGYSGASFDPQRVDIFLGEVQVAADGCGLAFDEEKAAGVLAREQVDVIVDLKQGGYSALAWGCDLTYEYVKINGSYRT